MMLTAALPPLVPAGLAVLLPWAVRWQTSHDSSLSGVLLLGQGNPAFAMARVLMWCAVLLGAAVFLGAVFFFIRKRLLNSADEDTDGLSLGFSLSDLRRMREQGQLSEEEFDYAKRKMTARARAQIVGDDPEDEPTPLHLEDPETFDPDDDPPPDEPPSDEPGESPQADNDPDAPGFR